MRRVARLVGFLAVCLFFLVFVAAAHPVLLGFSRTARMRLATGSVRLWARACLRILSLNINLQGLSDGLHSKRSLLVSNHQSYLDIVIIASVFPTLFVAKTEVSRWPLFGWLTKLGGTIFVDREDPRSGVKCAYRVSRALRDGVNVQVFPEATTGDGSTVLSFNGLFFASAVRSHAPVLPLTIKFQSVNGRPADREALDTVCWYGDMNFGRHFWNLLNIESAEVSLMINEPINPTRAQRAKVLAQAARDRIFRSFANADAISAARAEVPVEFARAEACPQPEGRAGNEPATAEDYIISAMLFSFFAPSSSGQGEPIRETAPQSKNE
ncbi:MAG TPA: 1-acyl-sn-glycerol-3-phosphate acyltransferase [Blastocatellia bacterium]|nr:1-acyl-sn-glycerol-3-phosphate acyltransferase [Blastocatellia bacterium]